MCLASFWAQLGEPIKSHMVVITVQLREKRERAIAVVKTSPNTDVTNTREWEWEFVVWKRAFTRPQRSNQSVSWRNL